MRRRTDDVIGIKLSGIASPRWRVVVLYEVYLKASCSSGCESIQGI